MSYKISKELFEAVCQDKVFLYVNHSDRIIFEFGHNKHQTYMSINDFFFKCIDFISTKGYVFVQDTRGFAMITHISTGKKKLWDDEEYNKQRVFDACQWILEK